MELYDSSGLTIVPRPRRGASLIGWRQYAEFTGDKMRDPKNLDEAYEMYKASKMLRKDMFRHIIDAIKELQARIGAVDEAAVADVRNRVAAMELTIGNALVSVQSSEKHRPGLSEQAWLEASGRKVEAGDADVGAIRREDHDRFYGRIQAYELRDGSVFE